MEPPYLDKPMYPPGGLWNVIWGNSKNLEIPENSQNKSHFYREFYIFWNVPEFLFWGNFPKLRSKVPREGTLVYPGKGFQNSVAFGPPQRSP